jgi:hypothetical protein
VLLRRRAGERRGLIFLRREAFGIEFAADPVAEFFVAGMAGIGEMIALGGLSKTLRTVHNAGLWGTFEDRQEHVLSGKVPRWFTPKCSSIYRT